MPEKIALSELKGTTFEWGGKLYVKTAGAIGRGGSSFLAVCLEDGQAAFPDKGKADWEVTPVEISVQKPDPTREAILKMKDPARTICMLYFGYGGPQPGLKTSVIAEVLGICQNEVTNTLRASGLLPPSAILD